MDLGYLKTKHRLFWVHFSIVASVMKFITHFLFLIPYFVTSLYYIIYYLYKQIKTSFGVETFLTLNIDRYEKSLLAQLRYGILPLRVETGRFVNEKRCDRICTFCNSGDIEDQIHFLFHCNLYEMQRNEIYVKARNIIERWDELSDIHKLASLFKHMSRALGKYVKDIFLLRRNKLYNCMTE